MRSLLFLPLFALSFLLLMGCSDFLYLSRLGWHQAGITFHSIPIQEVLKDEQADPAVREKILLIQEVKGYGEETLGLRKTKSYLRFYEVKGPILHVVTASKKDRLKLFETLYEYLGRDLRRMVEWMKEIRASGEEPVSYLNRWMKERGLTVSSFLR